MGCATSKIENEEVVALCGSRKRQVREAVRARHTFAAAFSGYVIALRTVGSAFSQFGEAEFRDPASPTSSAATNTAFNTPVKAPVAKPPPMPNFYSSSAGQQKASPSPMPPVLDPLQRSISLPALNLERKTVNKTASGNVQKVPAVDSNASPGAPTGKVSRTSSKKKMKTPPSPSPEPETPKSPKSPKDAAAAVNMVVHDEPEEEEQKSVHADVKASSVTSTESVNHQVKVAEEAEDDWVPVQPPPPPVPSNKPPPPPPPPRSGWDFDLFSFSHPEYAHPAGSHDEDFEESDRKKQEELQKLQEEEEKRRKLEQQKEEAERELKRKEEEDKNRLRQEAELKQRQQEQMRRRPSTVDEGEEGEEEEEEEDEEDDEEVEEDGEVEEEEGEEEEEEEKASSFEEKEKVQHEEPQKKTVNYDLPKKDLAIVTNHNRGREELVTVLKKIDSYFQEAYESGRNVANMLEAQRVSFHPNFIDSRSDETHAKKVLRAISWTSSSKSEVPRQDLPMDDDNTQGTHAATLDRLLAWEKKLFDEVKSAETIRVELEKKNSWILKEENRGGNPEAIEKAKTTVKSLTTRFMVAIQGVETARSALLKLRDSELYPQLLKLLNGIYEMWKRTHECHTLQYDQVMSMKKLDVSDVVESTNSLHKVATEQLKVALSRWHSYFGSVVSSHRDYMHHLNLYVKVSVKGLDIEKDRPLVSPASSRYPISALCHEWQLALDRLPDKRVLEAINNFVQELESIVDMQKEESRHRKRIEQLQEEVRTKEKSLQKYIKKHLKSSTVSTDVSGSNATAGSDGDVSSGSVASIEMLKERTPMIEKQAHLEVLKKRLEEEREKVDDLGQTSKHKTINSLQMGLPNIFYAVKAYSKQCLDAHHELHEFANTRLITNGQVSTPH